MTPVDYLTGQLEKLRSGVGMDRIKIQLPAKLLAQVREAKEEGESVSAWIRQAVRERLERERRRKR